MTSPQPPNPPNPATAAINEETLHLPVTVPGSASRGALPPHTMPSPYPPRPAFRPAPPPPPTAPTATAPHAHPQSQPVRRGSWEGLGFRPDIQGLRAIAVILVLLSHAGFTFFGGGYVGVDVFFVLSGFLITSLLVKEMHDTGGISLSGFFSRRARRILPVASVVVAATAVGSWLWFPVTRLEDVMKDAFTVILYVVNYRFVAEQSQYLNADQSPSPFQQYWSLAVEEQFYFVWPLLLIGVLLLAKRVPRKAVGYGIAAISAIFALSLIASVLVTETSPTTAYYAAHTRVWELAGGALLALTLPTWRKVPKVLALILGLVGLAAVIASALLYTEATPFPGYTAMMPVLGTMMMLVAGTARGGNAVSSLISTAPFQFVGKISYSLYLWHWPILILGPLALGVKSSLLLNVILLIGTFAVSQFSYTYIEEPVRKAKLLGRQPLFGIGSGILCSLLALVVIVGCTTVYSKVPEDETPVALEEVEKVEDSSVLEDQLREALEITSVPDGLQPSLTAINDDIPKIYEGDCHLGFDDVDLPDGCVFGDPDAEKKVLLFGDSHAAQWFPALEMIAEDEGWSLVSRTKSACTPVVVTLYNSQLERTYDECDEWREKVLDEIDEIQPDLVVIGTSDAQSLAETSDESENQRWSAGWEDLLGRATASAVHVVALTDTPRSQDETSPDCVALNQDAVQKCILSEDVAIRYLDRREAGISAQEAAGISVIDTAQWFCVDGSCPPIVGEYLVMRDSNHISTPYAVSLSDVLREALPQL